MQLLKRSQINNFDHLPDDVVLLILNKLLEAKWICRCSIVSKRFASLTPRIKNVSVKVPYLVSAWFEQEKGSTSVFYYLDRLKDIAYLHLEEHFFEEVGLDSSWFPLIKWKICDFNTKVISFTFVKASSLARVESQVVEDEKDDEEEVTEDEDEEEQLHQTNVAMEYFDDACMRLDIALDVIEIHQMLQSITITDSKNQGMVIVSGNHISELRDLVKKKSLMPKEGRDTFELVLKYCHLPLLYLPKSKFMMGGATPVYMRFVGPSFGNKGADVNEDMLAGSFDGHEGEVFNEAVKEILAKHKNKLNTGLF